MKKMAAIAVLLLCVLINACGRPRAQPTSEANAVWSCLIGTQGGFTGGGGGYEIHSDGRILTWSQITVDAGTDKSALGQVDHEQLLPLVEALAVPQLYRIELQETGNLTTFLEVRSSEHPTQRWSWPADRMGGRTVKVPTLVHNVYEAAMTVAQALGGGR